MQAEPDHLPIGRFAKAAGIGVEAVRFYQRKGLLGEPERPPGGIRRYGQADVARVRFIKAAQRLGFSLDDVAQLLTLEDGTHCSEAAEFATRHLADVRARLRDLKRMEAALSQLLARCDSQHGSVACPLIASLHGAR
ncbi:MAG: Hg(II)-responsive transcriptional regulator [Pseudomonadota bacterium]|nr:Hg(II)-responsive transcriptional regulator [Xanthomonadaceae bacterium]MDE3209857.1 Hg(II)-responsive transcriptional regulator [Pseudomonadota bacterium]